MKRILLGLLLCAAGVAQAASPLETYLAARDRYDAAINREADSAGVDRIAEKERRARADLEGQLRRLIGPVALKGFPADGTINLETLLKEQGYGKLDGLAYTARDGKASVVVTTEALLKHWLKAHKNWWPEAGAMPQDVGNALRAEDFYTQAISTDAAVSRFAEIPVTVPGAADAVALLVLRAQDTPGDAMPDEVIVSVVHDGRVFVASQPVAAPLAPLPACAAEWRGQKDKGQRAFAAFRRCIAKRLKEHGAYDAIVRQAQGLADRF